MKVSPESISRHLKTNHLIIETHDIISSTNTVLKERGRKGAPHGLVIAAAEQTAGRGRMGRSFFSPADTGIYFSILLRPSLSPQGCQLITTAASVSCARVLEKVSGETAQIKWVNDIYIKDKKVCGILTEASIRPNGTLDFAVLGIGINITPPKNNFPDDIIEKAGSVLSNSTDDLRGQIIADILNDFLALYETIEDRAYFNEYRQRSMLNGKHIEVLKNEQIIPATALYIDEELRLAVQYEDGKVEHLYTGDVSIKKL